MFLKTKKHLSFLLVLLIFFVAIAVLSIGLAFSTNLQIAYADVTTEPSEPNNDMIYWGITQTDSTSDIYDILVLSGDPQDIVGFPTVTVGSGGERIELFGSIQATSKEVPWNEVIRYSNIKPTIVEIKSVIRPVYMTEWFSNCDNITSIDLSNLDTSNTIDMSGLFYGCNLTALDLSGFNTSKVTNMSRMFRLCNDLTTLDLSNFDTSNVTDMSEMFAKCTGLTTLDLSNFDMSKVTNVSEMFKNCENLVTLDLSNANASKVTDMSSMFAKCSSLTSLNLSNFNTSNATNMSEMFLSCKGLTTLDLSNFNTSNVTDMSNMFSNCASLTNLNISNFDTSKVTNINFMFSYCEQLTTIDVSGFDTHNLQSMSSVFYGCTNLSSILGLERLDTSKVQDMNSLFNGCSKLTSIDLSGFNTSQVSNMSYMFYDCTNLASVDLTNIDLNKVWNMCGIFKNCTSLKQVDFSKAFVNGSTSSYATSMFDGCSSIEYINLSGMSITTETYYPIDDMLNGCDSLQEFVIPNIVKDADTIALPAVFWDGEKDVNVATSINNGMTLLRHDTHSIEHHEYKVPTCEENGNREYYYCTVCKKYFEDEMCENEIQDINSFVLKATGHEWQEPTYTWNGKSCTAQRVCSHDSSHIESETVEASVETILPSTCTQGGQDKYTAEFTNSVFATQTTQADTSALGHDYGEWKVVKEPTFDEFGEEQRVCLHDSTHIESRQTNKLFDYRWLIVIIVLSLIIVGEVVFLICHRVRTNKKESKK